MSGSSKFVAALTAAALAAVGFLAYQASANDPGSSGGKDPGASGSEKPGPAEESGPGSDTGSDAKPGADPKTPPPDSGTGERVVYSLGEDRVWLLDTGDKVLHTYRVTPSAVDPNPGKYAVTSRSEQVTGSDGVPIEHVVRFTDVGGVAIGFSAAVDGSTSPPDPGLRTGGVRSSRADATELWGFATVGVSVIVVK